MKFLDLFCELHQAKHVGLQRYSIGYLLSSIHTSQQCFKTMIHLDEEDCKDGSEPGNWPHPTNGLKNFNEWFKEIRK